MTSWFVYILRCSDNSLYTGITTDLERRIEEHNNGKIGAKYTRSRRPVILAYQESAENRGAACRREIAIKALTKNAKEALIKSPK